MNIKKQALEFLDETGMNKATFSKKLGVSPAVISLYLNGKYGGNSKNLEEKISQFLGREKERKLSFQLNYAETLLEKKIHQGCNLAFATKDIVLVVGAAGLGKTLSVKNYVKKTKSSFLIECDLSFTPKNILLEISNKLQIQIKEKNFFSVFHTVIEHLNKTDFLLIFDEAELLNKKTLETIRRLYDKTQIGVVLVGVHQLKENLRGHKELYSQMFSRIGLMINVGNSLSDDDLEKILDAQPNLKNFKKSLKELSKNNPRRLEKIIKGGFVLKKNGEDLNENLFKNYSTLLIK